MSFRHFLTDEARDAFGFSAERDAINDLTEGHPLFHEAIVGANRSDFRTYSQQHTGKRNRSGNSMPRKRPRSGNIMNVTPTSHTGPGRTSSTTYRAKYHTVLGENPSRRANRFAHKAIITGNSLVDKRLHTRRLIRIRWSASTSSSETRNKERVYVKGVNLRWTLKLKQDYDLISPLTVRWCIVQPETNLGNANDITGVEWFKDNVTKDDHVSNFPLTGDYTEYMSRPLNRQKFGIIKEGIFTVGPSTTGTATVKHWDSTKMMKIWIPINKVITFATNDSTEAAELPEANIHLVMWYCNRGDLTTNQKYPTLTPLEQLTESTVYFKNIHN